MSRISFVTENTNDVASDVNQSLLEADGLIVSRCVLLSAPPLTPANGDRVAVTGTATGDFAGHEGELAIYEDTGAFWYFNDASMCIVDDVVYVSDGLDWYSQSVFSGDSITIETTKTPATASATGTTGQIAWDANYIYVCIATDTWKRSAISSW